MSDEAPRIAATLSPTRLNLSQQRKRAKDLLRAYRRGEPEAERRVRCHLVDPPAEIKLAQAQLVVAREAGFRSWPRLKLYLAQSAQTRDQLVDTLLSAALAGHRASVQSALEIAPDLAAESLHAAAALADEAAVVARIEKGPADAVRRPAGALGGSPLAYLCHARLGREDPAVHAARARIARRLLSAGADPNECVDTFETPGGKFSVLSAAARDAASPELVNELLQAGAVVEPPGSTAGPPAPPLVSAAIGGNLACVRRLIAAGAPEWQAREALEVAIERNDPGIARALLDYGSLPDHAGRWKGRNGGCLHAAVALGRDVDFLRLLIEGGASVQARDRDGRTPLQIAVQLNEHAAAALFRSCGASEDELSDLDRWIGACFAGDASTSTRIAASAPARIETCDVSDHQNVCRAVRRGDARAVEQLLRAGFDSNAVDDDGETALHLAVARGDLEAVDCLVAHGASADLANYQNVTPRELALSEPDDALRTELLDRFATEVGESDDADEISEHLAARRRARAALFEQAVDRMSEGDLEGLRRLLDRESTLATARSARFHRATLLHYLGSNGTERPVAPRNVGALAKLLLERGAVADASCRMYGGGPHETALGLAATTDPSVYPAGALAELIRALVQGGARVHESDGRSRALEGAILYGATIALQALSENGARAYDLETAAALGDLRALETHLESASADSCGAALGTAASFGHVCVVEHLLASGVDPNARGPMGATALHRAAATNAVEAVRFLLAHGADPGLRDATYRSTPADWARHFGRDQALAALRAERKLR